MHKIEFDQGGLVRIRFSGPLKGPEALETLRALVRDPRYATGTSGLVDLRGVSSVEIFGDEVRASAQLMARLGDAFVGSRWAVVGASDPTFGIARQFELMLSDPRFEVRAFRGVEEAERWLTSAPPSDG